MCIKNIIRHFTAILIIINSSVLSFAQDHETAAIANAYFEKGEYHKAIDTFQDLVKNKDNIALIHQNYVDALYSINDEKTLKKYLSNVVKAFPNNLTYKIDQAVFLKYLGDTKQAGKLLSVVLSESSENEFKSAKTAETFEGHNLNDYAIKSYLQARALSSTPTTAYSLLLANLYRKINRESDMLEEYFNYASESEKNLDYIKNILQDQYTDEKKQNKLEELLIDKIQRKPDKTLYAEFLIWLNLQQKNFYSAFSQARALERRTNGDGETLFKIADIAYKNAYYDDAIKIYVYITENYKRSSNFSRANRLLLETREEKLKKTFPVDKEEVRNLVSQYDDFIKGAFGRNDVLLAIRKRALLLAFYLDKKAEAITTLETIRNARSAPGRLKSQVLMDLGDIYLLQNEPWEATLFYSQVEKLEKETNLGHEAKLRNAKLNYYQGNFDLAQSRLDILKSATSREIANDAIDLAGLIRNNTILDTSTAALETFAAIDLLLFQNQKIDALRAYEELLEKYPSHELEDDIWWRMGKIYLEMNANDEAREYFERIQTKYASGIYGDDSYYQIAKILENQGKKEQAQEMFKNLIIKYPGSSFMEDARFRYRALRGDVYTP